MNKPTKKVDYYEDGSISYEAYYLNDKRHRIDGPAYISYYENGSISYEAYYLNDKKLTKEEFLASKEHQNYLADLEIERMLDE